MRIVPWVFLSRLYLPWFVTWSLGQRTHVASLSIPDIHVGSCFDVMYKTWWTFASTLLLPWFLFSEEAARFRYRYKRGNPAVQTITRSYPIITSVWCSIDVYNEEIGYKIFENHFIVAFAFSALRMCLCTPGKRYAVIMPIYTHMWCAYWFMYIVSNCIYSIPDCIASPNHNLILMRVHVSVFLLYLFTHCTY